MITPKPLMAYYAHPIALYGSPIEKEDLRVLKSLGFKAVNPAKRKLDTMEDYTKLACSCDLVAFRAFEDGKIGSGVALEIMAAMKAKIPVIELTPFLPGRVLSRNETRKKMGLLPLRHPKTAPFGTLDDDEDLGRFGDYNQ